MRHFLGIFSQRRTVFLFIFLLFLSFIIMSFNDPFKLRGLRIAVLQSIAWSYSITEFFQVFGDLEKENQILREKLLKASIQNQKLQEHMLENIRLKRLLMFKQGSQYSFIPASVIGFGQEQTIRSLILNVGSADSIRKNQAVLTEAGLVGKILDAETQQALTQILMDRNTLVSARLQKSREVGVVGWSGNLWLDLYYIPKDVEVEPGEVVITSGLSRIYPKGIKIGVVAEVEEKEYELFKKIKIKPAVDFNRLEDVFVVLASDTLYGSDQ
jgi:rod shape-determining protein MreC